MPRYAAETTVPVERSRAEIEGLLTRYGASEFHSGWRPGQAMIAFRLGDLAMRFILPIPDRGEKRFTHRKNARSHAWEKRSDLQAAKAFDQEVRQRWRALALVIKAKLEAVECQISTLEQEFLAFIVLPDNHTFGEWVVENALPQIRGGKMPLALPAPPAPPADAEFTVVEVKR